MMQTFIAAYPWDLIDRDLTADRGGDLEGTLDRLRGEIGADGIALRVTAPWGSWPLPQPAEPDVLSSRGGILFHPDESKYDATRLKPFVASLAKSNDRMAQIAEACAQRGLALRVIISALHLKLGDDQRELACKAAYSDQPLAKPCLTHPDVQGLLEGLVRDLTARFDVAGATLADFPTAWDQAGKPDPDGIAVPSVTETALAEACFCESCVQAATAAGVDIEGARRSSQVLLDRTLQHGTPFDPSYGSILEEDPALKAYVTWRFRTLSSLLRRLAEACPCPLRYQRIYSGVAHLWQRHLDPDSTADSITLIRCPEHLEQVKDAIMQSPSLEPSDCASNELRIASDLTIGEQAQTFVSLMGELAKRGCTGVEIGGPAGPMTDEALTTIRQGIRLARRSVSV